MFDGLKDKLKGFRKDVEETAEEKAAEADDEVAPDESAPEADVEAASEPDVEAASEPDVESTPDVGGEEAPEETTGPESAADADVSAPASAEEGARTASGAAAASADADADTSADTDSSVGADASVGADDSASEDTSAGEDTSADADEDAAGDGASGESDAGGPGRFKRAAAFATGKIIIEEEDLEGPLWELEKALLESNVEVGVAEQILDTVEEKMIGETRAQVESTGELVAEALHDALLEVISVGQFDFDERVANAEKPVVLVFTGVNGVGKTTTIAKLSEYFDQRGYSSVLANGDTYRAGANEQISQHADNLGRRLISHEQGGDPAAVIYDAVEYAEANDVDIVLGDTAGRLHTNEDLMDQLEKIDRVVGPDMTLFVDESVAGQDAVQRATEFDAAAEIDGTILTKADADSQGGAAISIAHVTGKPILFLGTGQGYDDIAPFDPEALVAELLDEEQ